MQMFVSTAEAMQRCWKATDALFAGIEDWSVQPIDVRHPFGFYYGHLASFAKLKALPQVTEICIAACACLLHVRGCWSVTHANAMRDFQSCCDESSKLKIVSELVQTSISAALV